MTTTPILTGRDIGEAERATRALLDSLLDEAGLSFPEWTVLFTLDGTGPLAGDALVHRQVDGHVVPDAAAAQATIDGLRSTGLLAPTPTSEAHSTGGPGGDREDAPFAITAAGEAIYRPIRLAVSRITDELYGDLPSADLEATRRTLAEIARRANARLTTATS